MLALQVAAFCLGLSLFIVAIENLLIGEVWLGVVLMLWAVPLFIVGVLGGR